MRRFERLLPWIVAIVVGVFGIAIIDPLPVGVVHDDAMYVILAKSIATGQGYRWIHLPGAPPATHFPPGYPVVLAAVWRLFPIFPANVIAFKVLNALLLAAAAAGVAVFARRRLQLAPATAAAVALVGALSVPSLLLSTLVLSEPLFLALLVPLLLVAERLVEGDAPAWRSAVVGLAAGVLTLVRSQAVALVAAIVLVLALRGRTRHALVAAAAAFVAMAPWQLWVRAHEGFVAAPMRGNYESYVAWLVQGMRTEGPSLLLRTAEQTSGALAALVGIYASGTFLAPLRWLLGATALMLCAVGSVRLWRQAPVTMLFLASYFAIVLFWPFNPSRFLSGVWPLVFALPVLGAMTILEWRPDALRLRMGRFELLALASAATIGFAACNVEGYRERWWSSIGRRAVAGVSPLVSWVRRATQPTDVIVSNAEPMVYLYTGRQSVPATSFTVQEFFHPASVAERSAALRVILADYHATVVAVVADDSLLAAADGLARRHPAELALRDTFPGGAAFTPLHR